MKGREGGEGGGEGGRGGREGGGGEGGGEGRGGGGGGEERGGEGSSNAMYALHCGMIFPIVAFYSKVFSQIMFLLLSCTHLKVVVHGVGHPESSVVRRLHLYTVAVIAHACMHTQHVCTQHTHTHSTLQALEASPLTSRMSEI